MSKPGVPFDWGLQPSAALAVFIKSIELNKKIHFIIREADILLKRLEEIISKTNFRSERDNFFAIRSAIFLSTKNNMLSRIHKNFIID